MGEGLGRGTSPLGVERGDDRAEVERVPVGDGGGERVGRGGGRPREMTASGIRMAMATMADPAARPGEVARELGVTATTLYEYVDGDGSPEAAAEAVLRGAARP